MPAPVTHILLALSVLPLLPDKDPKEFILGTSFPDIRYLKVIDRNTTHDPKPSWQKVVQEKSSFKAGMELHALADKIHDKYMLRKKVYASLPAGCRQSSSYLKFFEDILLYTHCNTWQHLMSYFDTISQDSRQFIDQDAIIESWQYGIKRYIAQQPTPEDVAQILDVKIPTWWGPFLRVPIYIKAQYMSSVLLSNMAELMQNRTICDAILEFYNNFPDLVATYGNGTLVTKPAQQLP